MTARIREFQFNASPWRIDWLGHITYSGSSRSEPVIAVYLSELKSDFDNPLSNSALKDPHTCKSVQIKAGQLSLLRIGSVWIDGVEATHRSSPTEISFSLPPDTLELLRFDSSILIDGQRHQLITDRRYKLSRETREKVSGSWLAYGRDIKTNSKSTILLIPSSAIFQKCIATSPKAIRRLVHGELNKIIDPNYGFLIEEPTTFYIELFKDFRNSEGIPLANIVADPIGHREFKRFRNTLVVASANARPNNASPNTHIKLTLPFSNPTNITAKGKFLPFDIEKDGQAATTWAFLVTEILTLTTKLVFEKLIIDRKNNAKAGSNADDLNLSPAWETPIRTQADIEEETSITSADDPRKELEKLALEAAGGFEAEGLQIISQEKDTQQYKGKPKKADNDVEADGTATTGDPQGAVGGAHELDVVPDQPPKIPVTIDQFFETLALLNCKGFPFKTIAVSRSTRRRESDNGIVNFFPHFIKGVRSWHLTDDITEVPRCYVVAELCLGNVWRYLIELQRKGAGSHSLLYVRHHSGTRIEPPQIAQFMLAVAAENGWAAKKYYKNWVCTLIRHTPSRGTQAFAQAIINKL